MKNIPQYVLDKSLLPQLSDTLRETSLDVRQIGLPKTTVEGTEQAWECCDKSGEFFSFGTCEVSDKNAFGLKAGVVYLEVGPPARVRSRKDVSAAFKRFESAILRLGARRLKEGNVNLE